MFRGLNLLNIDAKGRFAMPTRYRDYISQQTEGKMVFTIDTDERCLLLYALSEWEVIEEKLQALPSFNAAARRIQRLLLGHASEVELDGQGRLLMPALLREHATLDKRLMLVGQGKKFEVWSDTLWQQQRQAWIDIGVTSVEDKASLPDVLDTLSL